VSDRGWLLLVVAINAANLIAALVRTWLQWRQHHDKKGDT
jgi:hypothetical protein